MKFNVGDLVWIKWEDHYHEYTPGWRDPNDINDDPLYNETVGWVIKDNKYRLTTVSTRQEDGMSNGGYSTKIKSCIVNSKVLRKKK